MSLPIPTQFDYSEPQKRIHDSQGLHLFQTSIALIELEKSLSLIISSVEGKNVPQGVLSTRSLYTDEQIKELERESTMSSNISDIPKFNDSESNSQLSTILNTKPIIKSLVDLFNDLSKLVDETPPFEGPRRYGNLACRDWHTKIESGIDALLTQYILPYYKFANPSGFKLELKWYILNSFGSKERLDFGTGHELNFLAFLTGLWKVQILQLGESGIDGYDLLVIFGNYYNLVRKLIVSYTLEPAGSHGVWGLDDHFHLIYILGASQLINKNSTNTISPKLINNKAVVFQYSTKNLYFNSIAFIYKVKKGPFFEHSPILYDISNVKSWEKIQKGLLKMYQVEVIGKFPVVQHFYFGNVLFPWKNINGASLPVFITENSTDGHDDKKDMTHMNHDWESKITPSMMKPAKDNKKHQQQEQQHIPTSVPWKNSSSAGIPNLSLQDRIKNATLMQRTPSPKMVSQRNQSPQLNNDNVTRAPWAKK